MKYVTRKAVKRMNKRIVSFTFALIILFFVILLYKGTVGSNPGLPTSTICVNPATSEVGLSSATAVISVDPSTRTAEVGQTFTININISDVVDLYGWEFRLRWNSTLLDALNVTEGTFLKGGGNTFFWPKINNTEGYILADCTLLGDVSGVNGSGTLATVEFYVEGRGESILDLHDTKLVSSLEQSIAHTAIDGYGYFTVHDVAITNVWPSKTTATPGEIVYIYVTVENQGNFKETFTVTTSYTLWIDPVIGTQTVTLASGASTTLTFTWDTTGVSGYCTLRATASVVSGETDTTDNTYTDGTVCIW